MSDAPSLAEADRLRDTGDWPAAAAAYAAWLTAHPADWDIWVQHGHCVKEAGDPRGALASYRRAEAGLPRDPDVKVQIGHAAKLAGDFAAARAAYAAALDLDGANDVAWREWLATPVVAEASVPAGLSLMGDAHVVLDLSDLMAWFGGARGLTGIQRVQTEIAAAALRPGAPAASVELAVFRAESGTWRALPREVFRRLAALSRSGTDPVDPAWVEAAACARAALEHAPDLDFAADTWLVNPGSSWEMPNYHLAVRHARARHGIRYAAVLHDCGPVTVPEHVPPATASRFARWLSVLSVEADLILAVSEATARDLAQFRVTALAGLPTAPVKVLRLDALPSPPPSAPPHPRVAALAGTEYVLCVGTIESRKDHLFTLHAWLKLTRQRGGAVPKLVLVGRVGFGGEPALALLNRAPELTAGVVRLDDVPDAALAELLRGALFTIYNSAHEGWGLPVTEALAAGKVVVAPAHSGLLESGTGLACHFAYGSEPEFLAMIGRLIDDAAFRAEIEARIAADLRLRSWNSVTDDLLTRLGDVAERVPPPAPALGLTHGLGSIERPRPEPAMLWADTLRAGPAWHMPETWGCWTRPGRAVLRLPVETGRGTRLRVEVALRAAVAGEVMLRVDRGETVTVTMETGARPVFATDIETRGSAVEIAIETEPAELRDGRMVGVGVEALMACRPEDLAARVEFLERVGFVWGARHQAVAQSPPQPSPVTAGEGEVRGAGRDLSS